MFTLYDCMQIGRQGNLQDDDGGDALLELLVQRLVMPNPHTRPSSYATSDGCQGEEGGFGYAPFGFLRLVFVHTIEDECHDIGGKQVIE